MIGRFEEAGMQQQLTEALLVLCRENPATLQAVIESLNEIKADSSVCQEESQSGSQPRQGEGERPAL